MQKLQQRQIEAEEGGASRDFQINLGQQLEDLENLRDTYQRLQPGIDEAAIAQARFNDALAITTPLTDSLFDSLIAVVEGTKTAEQAFADFLRSIADMLFQAAKQMIAQYIAIGIARMFAGMGGGTVGDGGTGPLAKTKQTSLVLAWKCLAGAMSGARLSAVQFLATGLIWSGSVGLSCSFQALKATLFRTAQWAALT